MTTISCGGTGYETGFYYHCLKCFAEYESERTLSYPTLCPACKGRLRGVLQKGLLPTDQEAELEVEHE